MEGSIHLPGPSVVVEEQAKRIPTMTKQSGEQ